MARVIFVTLYLLFISAAFVVAAHSFASDSICVTVLVTASLASVLFIERVRSWKQKSHDDGGGLWRNLGLLWMWHNWDIVLVGVATHHSMLMIGVSLFGKVVLDPSISNMTVVTVVIHQVFLNYAAAKLVDAFGKARIEKS